MSQYRIWKNPSGVTESVKQGWSWPAFLFSGLWAVAKRMTLLGICMILGGLVIECAMAATRVDDEDGILLLALISLLSLFFGANGNSWRERHLVKRGFVPVETTVRTPVRTLFAQPIAGLKVPWHDTVWSKVIAGIILGTFGTVGTYVLRPHPVAGRLDGTQIASHHSSVPTCKEATINGHVQPNGFETFAWFEWGETPDLGSVTTKQRFTGETDYYQDLVGLKENTTYFYKTIASNSNGTSEGRVVSFTTARCRA